MAASSFLTTELRSAGGAGVPALIVTSGRPKMASRGGSLRSRGDRGRRRIKDGVPEGITEEGGPPENQRWRPLGGRCRRDAWSERESAGRIKDGRRPGRASVSGPLRVIIRRRQGSSKMALLLRCLGHPLLRPPVAPVFSRQWAVAMATNAKQEMAQYWEKNEGLKRPISPHISIYRWSLPMAMSVMHRGTGAALSAGVSLFAVAALTLPGDFSLYVDMIRSLELPSALIFTSKFAICFPFTYHTWNGLRHLVWDSGNALKIPQVEVTGYLVVALTIASCLGLASM